MSEVNYPDRMYDTDLCQATLDMKIKFKNLVELEVKLEKTLKNTKVLEQDFSWGNLSLRRRKELRERRQKRLINIGTDKK